MAPILFIAVLLLPFVTAAGPFALWEARDYVRPGPGRHRRIRGAGSAAMTTYDDLDHVPCVLWRWTSCTPDAPAHARFTLGCALDQLGFDEAVISDAVLAVSELVANAAEHAVGPYEMRLRRTAAGVICN
ncbi:ATP-binding protein [Streptomyces mirabilis]|uniref:ATP-binding protein n=1 Tax=Streptomyces mirabilis TaxID=68239 RepID=UPI0036C8DA3A